MEVWIVPGLHGVSAKDQTATEYIKKHIHRPQFELEARLLRIAHSAGCAPEFTTEPPMTIRTRLHDRLLERLGRGSASDTRTAASRVLSQLHRLHAAGVCHRDLKPEDIVMDGDTPLFIDFDLGAEVDPNGPCYDLIGAEASGIPLPPIHACIGLREGVWWDTPTTRVRPLWHVLGRLPDVEREHST